MRDRVELYAQRKATKERLEEELATFQELGAGGLVVQFVGISRSISLYKQTSNAMLPEIEKVYRKEIAECVRDMNNIDTEIGN